MKKIFFVLLAVVFCLRAGATQTDSLWVKLKNTMMNKEHYVSIKEQNIENIKQILLIDNLLPRQEYDINKKMYEEYKKYRADSAIIYVRRNEEIALALNNPLLIDETTIQLAWLYSTTGSYIEASEMLDRINRRQLSETLLPLYFTTYADFCSHYGQSNNNQEYYRMSELYRDSLLLSLDSLSFQYRMEYATRQMFARVESENILLNLLDETDDGHPDRGSIAWLIGYMYQMKGNIEMCKKYYTISAIIDVENCTNDNASLHSLAIIYYRQGDIEKAYSLIHQAVEDARSCNVRYRISEASTYYPIINALYQDLAEKQMTRLYTLIVIISVLLIFLAVYVVFFYRQNKALSRMRRQLSATNKQLEHLNHELTSANNKLQESNLIKEEYIANFFDICSAYVEKLETYRRMLVKHGKHERVDEMLKVLDYNVIESELNDLYYKFDTIFINLYPTFVEDFNAIRPESDKIVLKHGELMNTELRIFALIRLGFNDSIKIASFLRYSLSAIYNYRVKARKYCDMDKKTFEEALMKMGLPNE